MEFRALNKETMEAELSTDEIGELLRQGEDLEKAEEENLRRISWRG